MRTLPLQNRRPTEARPSEDVVADIIPKVMHKRRSKISAKSGSESPPLVNNLATEEMDIVKTLPSDQDNRNHHAAKSAPSKVMGQPSHIQSECCNPHDQNGNKGDYSGHMVERRTA
jgi:hypothetical protein